MKILLADDHPLFREGIKPVLRKLDPHPRIIEARDYPSAFEASHRASDLDLALLDLCMPGMSDAEGVTRYRATFPDIPLVVVSASEQPESIHQMLAAGALGYICKSSPSEVILGALRLVLAGGVYLPPNVLDQSDADDSASRWPIKVRALTQRQLEVLRLLVDGRTNKQIATVLQVTEGTVKIHMAAIFRILKVNNRMEAMLAAQKMGLKLRG